MSIRCIVGKQQQQQQQQQQQKTPNNLQSDNNLQSEPPRPQLPKILKNPRQTPKKHQSSNPPETDTPAYPQTHRRRERIMRPFISISIDKIMP